MYKKILSAPFIFWIACGTIIPLCVIAYYGMTTRAGAFTTENIFTIFSPDYAQALGISLLLAAVSTLVCFILAYPLALILKDSKFGKQGFIIFVFVLPMWMNFLLRTMAWQVRYP